LAEFVDYAKSHPLVPVPFQTTITNHRIPTDKRHSNDRQEMEETADVTMQDSDHHEKMLQEVDEDAHGNGDAYDDYNNDADDDGPDDEDADDDHEEDSVEEEHNNAYEDNYDELDDDEYDPMNINTFHQNPLIMTHGLPGHRFVPQQPMIRNFLYADEILVELMLFNLMRKLSAPNKGWQLIMKWAAYEQSKK
jgi:hypothetical protein